MDDKNRIKKNISEFDISQPIYLKGLDYFLRDKNRSVLYFTTVTDLDLKEYRDTLHVSYRREDVIDNSFDFSPHITFLRILDSKVFEMHRENIEKIIINELNKLKKINISKEEISLFAVNSLYKEEIQIIV